MSGPPFVARYAFDDFELDAHTLELFKDGHVVRLQRQPALMLLLLVERAGTLVPKDQMRQHIWGGERFVDFDRSLAFGLRQIRAALGDDPRSPRYVETLRGLGYRFVGPVRALAAVPSAGDLSPRANQSDCDFSAVPSSSDLRTPRWKRHVGVPAALIVVAIVASALWTAGRTDGPAPEPSGRSTATGTAVLLQRADEYLNRARPDDVARALTMYQDALARLPASSHARAGVAGAEAWLAGHRRDQAGAERALAKALEASRRAPDDPTVAFVRAFSLQVASHFEDAADEYRAILKRSPDRAGVLDNLARLEYERGRLDEAFRLIGIRLSTLGLDASPAGLLGVILTELGFEVEGLEWTQLARRLAPGTPQAQYLEGLHAVRAGDLDAAERVLTDAVQAQPAGATVLELWAAVVAHRHGPTAVLPRLEAAARSVPDSHHVRALLATAYAAAGRAQDARRERARSDAICRAGLEAAPESPHWPRCLASRAATAGDRDAAVGWYARAVALGWRKLSHDRDDSSLAALAGDARFREAQSRLGEDLERMRRAVARAGVPRADLDARW